jgi:riboflavin kinase / FMN adenylyltransferase
MKLVRAPGELQVGPGGVCLAIGFFDGVHLGHQQIIRQTIADARQHEALALVITFDHHPNTIVAPDRIPPLIYSLDSKLLTIESLGPEAVLLVHFDKAFSQLNAETFIRDLAREVVHVRSICVGANFTFGHKRAGNVELLTRLGAELNFVVHALASVSLDGKTVSSTRIRESIRSGNLDAAGQMLGRAYALRGPVIRGDGLGQKLGFPTANLDTSGLVLPPKGVYAVQVQSDSARHHAVLNIGVRPTLQSPTPELRVEVHLLDFSGNLYDQDLEITFLEKLREEKKFPNLQELKDQIGRDITEARALF